MQFKLLLPFLAVGLSLQATENPISKVLSLLDDLRQKVLLDGEVEQKQYEKYTEWCEDEAVAKQYQIKNGKAKIEDLSAVIEKATAGISNADSVIADLAKSLTANENDLKAAQEIRDKEHADFEAADKDLEETVDMLGRAIGILEKNLKSNSFAQISKTNLNELTQALTVVMKVGLLQSEDTSKLQGFLQAAESSDDKEVDDYLARSAPDAKVYESHSGSLIDTLEDMKEKAVAMRNDGQKAELSSKHAFEMLKQSLEGELKVDRKAMDAAKSEKAQASEAKATAEGDLAMTQKMVGETQEYLADMSSSCQQKANDWAVSQKSRAEELDALTQAQKIIAEKTGASTSRAYDFVQFHSKAGSKAKVSPHALEVVDKLTKLGRRDRDTALTQLALRAQAAFQMGAGDVFAKVRGMITEMIDKLVADAAEEADHKAWCDKETAETQEKIEDHTSAVEKLGAKIDKAEAQIAQLTESVAALQKALAENAKLQAKMDTIRADDKAAFKQAKKDFTDGVEGLTMALQILREYYAKEGDAFVQQPSDPVVHAKSGDAATGIIGLLEVAESDFTKLLADAEVEEESAQKAYEKVTHETKVDTAMKQADVKYQTKEKAGLEKTVADLKEDREGEQAELDAVTEYYARVRPGCTTKPMTYEERKQRRESEIAGLKEALTILEAESPEGAAFLAVRTTRRAYA
jgi:hypothetical protein